jgi:glyoxylase-like metal-dependent hydrolase (beta-lactamase superfamily II)
VTDSAPYRVYAVRYGERLARRGEHFAGYDERSGEPHETAYFLWAAVSPDRTVIVDTGMRASRAAALDGLEHVAPVEALADLDVVPEAVDHLVLTHLHYDHAGGVADYPRARAVLQQAELDYWTGPLAERIGRERWLLDDEALAHVRAAAAGARVDLIDGDAEVLPGLSVHRVGGHTAGLQVVRVRTAHGHAVIASDAALFYENLEDDRPGPLAHSVADVYSAFDRVNALADDPDLVLAGHDPRVLDRFPTLTDRVAVVA